MSVQHLVRDRQFNPTSTKKIKLTKSELATVLKTCEWNKSEAGRRLGLSRVSIWKSMKKWNIPLDGKDEMK